MNLNSSSDTDGADGVARAGRAAPGTGTTVAGLGAVTASIARLAWSRSRVLTGTTETVAKSART